MSDITQADLDALTAFDTPTICNALERLDPSLQGSGYTTEPCVCGFPAQKPVIGYARTAAIRSAQPLAASPAEQRQAQNDYYRHIDAGPKPSIVVIQDLDGADAGYGAFWGEVHTAVHKALGAEGCVTNGSFRDLDMLAKDFQIIGGRIGPSHAHVHLVDFGKAVNVCGMHAAHDDVIHADYHGAVVIPAECVAKLPEAIDLVSRRERVILDVCADPEFTPAKLREAVRRSGEIH